MIKNSDIIKLVIAIFIFLFNPFDGKSQDRDVEEYVRIAIEDFCKRKHSSQSDIYRIDIDDFMLQKYDLEISFNPCDTLDGFWILENSEVIPNFSWLEYNGKLFYWQESGNVERLDKELLGVLRKYNFYRIVDSCEYCLGYRPMRYYTSKTVAIYSFVIWQSSTKSPKFKCRTFRFKGRPKDYFKYENGKF